MQQLDYRRLGKQRVETRQIHNAIYGVRNYHDVWDELSGEEYRTLATQFSDYLKQHTGRRPGWATHAATMMWINNLEALGLYGDCSIREWVRRGYNNTMHLHMCADIDSVPSAILKVRMPHWLGDEEVHSSHRSNLLRKDPEFYAQFNWDDGPEKEYVWPVG